MPRRKDEKMYELNVCLPDKPYKIHIESGSMKTIGKGLGKVFVGKRVLIVSDDNVYKLYGEIVESALKQEGFQTDRVLIRPGETSKNIDGLMAIINSMAEIGIRRDCLVIALGGGVVGDMAGFASAIYMRGLPYVQVPTTLLAQVDSSVGGKTGIDLAMGKNLLGAFHQPLSVFIDPDFLTGLNEKTLAEGMAEIIKYGAIVDSEFFSELESYGGIEESFEKIGKIIYRCCSIKASFVEGDEKDKGERQKLNFGHSFGHAMEKMGNFERFTHGEAVAMGMVLASRVGEALGVTEKGTAHRIENIVKNYKLPWKLPEDIESNYKDLVDHMKSDKKNQGSILGLILLKNIGESIMFEIEAEKLLEILESDFAPPLEIKCKPHGRINLPPSKSLSHRALICSSLAMEPTRLANIKPLNEDIKATLACLTAMGLEYKGHGVGQGNIEIEKGVLPFSREKANCQAEKDMILDCGESGSTLRFLIPLALLSDKPVIMTGAKRLMERPLKELLQALEKNGGKCCHKGERLELQGPITSGVYELSGNISSQFISGLLMALPLLEGRSEIRLTTQLESKAYVDMTIDVMEHFGIKVEKEEDGIYRIEGKQKYRTKDYNIEGDFSAGAYFLVAGALGCQVECGGLNEETLQGDREILDFIRRCGGKIVSKDMGGLMAVSSGNLEGITADISQCPDLAPPLSVLLCFCKGVSKIVGAKRLRMKESDRLTSIRECLNSLGAKIIEEGDTLIITGVEELDGGIVYPYNDHRIAMAGALASIKSLGPVKIMNPNCVNKSYPNFYNDFCGIEEGEDK